MIFGSFHWQLYWAHLNSFVLLLLMGPHVIYSYFYSMGPVVQHMAQHAGRDAHLC
jgi:putative Mn2+ efflux pump MntP